MYKIYCQQICRKSRKAKSWLSHFGILSTWNWSMVPWEDAWKKTTTTWDGIELCLDSTFKLSTIPLPLLQTYSFQVVHTALKCSSVSNIRFHCSFVFSFDQQILKNISLMMSHKYEQMQMSNICKLHWENILLKPK